MKKTITFLFLLVSMCMSAQIFIWKNGQIICQCDEHDSYDSIVVVSIELRGIDTLSGRVNGVYSVSENQKVYLTVAIDKDFENVVVFEDITNQNETQIVKVLQKAVPTQEFL